MARYDLQEARKYISRALRRLNKVRNLNITLLNLEYTELIGWDFIKASLYDKTLNYKFDSMLNEIIFTRDGIMSNLDKAAGIYGKELDDYDKAIIRIAYTIWRDWKETRNANVN